MTLDSTTIFGNPGYNQTNATYGVTSKILTLYIRDPTRTVYADGTLTFTVGNYTAPPSTQTTDDFVVTILRNGYPTMSGTTTLTASASTLSGSSAMEDTTVNT